jgi:hypothetical protein
MSGTGIKAANRLGSPAIVGPSKTHIAMNVPSQCKYSSKSHCLCVATRVAIKTLPAVNLQIEIVRALVTSRSFAVST